MLVRGIHISNCFRKAWSSFFVLAEKLPKLFRRRLKELHVTSKLFIQMPVEQATRVYEIHTINGVAHGMWSPVDRCQSSIWRELVAVQRVLKSLKNSLANHRVKWFTDKNNVCIIVQKGSMRPFLLEMALDIFSFCSRHCISIELEWLARKLNQRAHSISRINCR